MERSFTCWFTIIVAQFQHGKVGVVQQFDLMFEDRRHLLAAEFYKVLVDERKSLHTSNRDVTMGINKIEYVAI